VRELLTRLLATLDAGLPCVWCVVAATRGSTPQKAGAAMLVFPDGTQAGTLGGGCVEAEVRRQALAALAAGAGPAVHSFLLNDDYGWDDGLICGGRMTILAHPIPADICGRVTPYYRAILSAVVAGEGFTEALVIEGCVGDRYLFDSTGRPITCLAAVPNWGEVAGRLPALADRPRPAVSDGVASLPSPPRGTLLIVGGGHVGQAVSRLAVELGFAVWVLDDREKFANADRFPGAERVLVGDIGTTLRDLRPHLTANTFALIVTRGHNHDEEALYHLAGSACGYVGMIGSKRKVRLIFDDLAAKGVPAEALERVRAPVGVDIGSQTVPEIALSIAAELVAWRNRGGPA
jgi:xanthine dehydrogenase accessory factor